MRRGQFTFIVTWLFIGFVIGVAGGLFYSWRVDPRVQTDVRPAQLSDSAKQQVLITVALAYAKDRDLLRAGTRINDLGLNWQAMADLACQLSQTAYISSSAGLIAVRSMVDLAGSQGAKSCASVQLPSATETPRLLPTSEPPTPTRIPAPTKTATPTLGPTFTPPIAATEPPTPTGDFSIQGPDAVCDPKTPGIILVFVRDLNDTGIPGVAIELITADSRARFFTGLMPERDAGYADFGMTPGESYQVQLPGLSERSRRMEAVECTAKDGTKTRASYRVIFKRNRTP